MNTEQRITSIPVNYYKTRDGKHEVPVIDLRETGYEGDYPFISVDPTALVKREWLKNGRLSINHEQPRDLMIPPPEPEMVRVPLEMNDIPQGAEFRNASAPSVRLPYGLITSGGVALGLSTHEIPYQELMDHGYLMRAPGGEWVPCWKEVAK